MPDTPFLFLFQEKGDNADFFAGVEVYEVSVERPIPSLLPESKVSGIGS
ncbi:MAG: hypothetical protein Pg6A_12720 [Termitinemataceae bacterium]|nr:MAG: hypothetical protein Pg6A_12720 [Termitinemataceae bacterium]